MIKFLETRKIQQHTVKMLGWTEEKNQLTFNFFEGSTVVNKKFRSIDKRFSQTPNGKKILYNINSAIDQKEIVIVEGELDVASFYEIGIKNVISVPSGSSDANEHWENSKDYIAQVEHFIIAVDCDDVGLKLREKIAQRLGRYRCSYLEFEGKDAIEHDRDWET